LKGCVILDWHHELLAKGEEEVLFYLVKLQNKDSKINVSIL
jgi:hypothetical protein